MPGALPDLRHEPESRHVRLQKRMGGPAARRPQIAPKRFLVNAAPVPSTRSSEPTRMVGLATYAESQTTTLEDADGQAPDARRIESDWSQRMPALPRAQAAASHLLELRLLPWAPGASGRRRLS